MDFKTDTQSTCSNTIPIPNITFYHEITEQTTHILKELLEVANLPPFSLLVVGCSSSEVANSKIGTHSSAEIGSLLFSALYEELNKRQIYLVAQCCEHLNRALILEEEAALRYHYEAVNVVPQLKAGGSFATAAYSRFQHPVAVEQIQAHAGIDIGNTLIGMHLKPVAVPFQPSISQIGFASVVCARTRPKFIGGERAHYNPANY